MRVVLTGGGTGGHLYPALAVVDALRRTDPALDVRFVGGTSGIEAEVVPSRGIQFIGVSTRKLRRVLSPSTLGVLSALWRGYREARLFLGGFRPDVVVGTGGYVAAATVLAAVRSHIPAVIHEQNAVPGRTNRWVASSVDRVCVSFEEAMNGFPANRTVLTGCPIRPGIVSTAARDDAVSRLGFGACEFTLLVLGGSQGAQRLNDVVCDSLVGLQGVQVLHQTGRGNYQGVMDRTGSDGRSASAYRAVPYLGEDDLPLAYRAADLVVTRCGASTLAEITANGLPALMVPLPSAYADHQTANARALERAGAGVLLPQASFTPAILLGCVERLRAEAGELRRMSAASRGLGRPEAADHVAREAVKCAVARRA